MTLNTTEEGVAEIIDALRDSKLNISEEGVAKLRDALRDSHNVSSDDATWILTSAFIIFTMQSGKSKISSIQLPTVLFLEHMQTVQTQIRRHRTWCLIWVSSVCLQIWRKMKTTTQQQ